jgi:hypothetical protein
MILTLSAEAAPDDSSTATDIRSQMLAEYKYASPSKVADKPLARTNDPKGTHAAAPAQELDPNIVRMAPFKVRDNARLDSLHSQIMADEATARTDAMIRRMGIGVQTANAGPGEFYAVTVFYIPIQIGYLFRF